MSHFIPKSSFFDTGLWTLRLILEDFSQNIQFRIFQFRGNTVLTLSSYPSLSIQRQGQRCFFGTLPANSDSLSNSWQQTKQCVWVPISNHMLPLLLCNVLSWNEPTTYQSIGYLCKIKVRSCKDENLFECLQNEATCF